MYTLTLQIYANRTWQDAMTLAFEGPQTRWSDKS